jgi:hypothetical protein
MNLYVGLGVGLWDGDDVLFNGLLWGSISEPPL